MTSLIFGANGQDGYYLKKLLEQQGHNVIGISRYGNFINANIADYSAVQKLVSEHQPEYIFHLAANSNTKHENLFENHAAISTGTLNVLESTRQFSPHSKVFLSGSGLQFRNESHPIKESDPFEARNVYSICRIQSVYAARYFRTIGIKTYVGYFFNHDSPMRSEEHITKKISEAAKRIASGRDEKLEIGDTSVIKEYGFAGDIVKGIWLLVNQDKITEANISTGKGYSIEDWLDKCFSLVGKNWKDHVAIKRNFISEYQKLVSDPSLIFSIGWKPHVTFEELAKMMME
jgi:GDPmannose 4,6-dehydratase